MVLSLGIAVFLQQFFLLQQVLLRSRFRFRSAAAQMTVLGVATILFGLPLLTFGLIGLAVSQVLVYVVALAMAGRLLGGIPRPTWDPVIARRLVSVGFPIMLAGLLFGLLTTIDRWLVLIYLDRVQVGYYGIVGITVSGLLLLPGIVSQQYYPRLAFAYGAGQGGEALLALASRQSLISGGLVGVAAIAAAFVAVIGIPRFLPAYETAVVPLLVTLVGLGIYGLGAAFGDLLNTIGAQRRYLADPGACPGRRRRSVGGPPAGGPPACRRCDRLDLQHDHLRHPVVREWTRSDAKDRSGVGDRAGLIVSRLVSELGNVNLPLSEDAGFRLRLRAQAAA